MHVATLTEHLHHEFDVVTERLWIWFDRWPETWDAMAWSVDTVELAVAGSCDAQFWHAVGEIAYDLTLVLTKEATCSE